MKSLLQKIANIIFNQVERSDFWKTWYKIGLTYNKILTNYNIYLI